MQLLASEAAEVRLWSGWVAMRLWSGWVANEVVEGVSD